MVPLTLKSLFASRLRVEVLSHFFFHPAEEFYVRQLAAELAQPVGTVARELAHLEQAGILTSRPVGNQKHYGLCGDCPILDELRNIFLKTSGAGAELRTALEAFPGVEIAFIYGSYAGGQATASSDIDLMVVGGVTDKDIAPAVAQVERRLKREINYTLYTRSEVERRLGEKGDFVHEVFTGPRIMLIGNMDDRLLEAAR
ncbi:MAG: helix-turn-helix domain-containing protein [Planctomycetes bacterium]|nr:helix-turn-helix domain-containing protein [Planctomycetota bacterium]